ncbi:hypothetical protein AGMMS50233_00160 [Endomicrobiia bacterium]|nr:hypothetical protein AGMMS50233_00160 [Endomicrobiia bacterium]
MIDNPSSNPSDSGPTGDDELDEDAPAPVLLLELELSERELVDRPGSPGEKTLRFELLELRIEMTDDAPHLHHCLHCHRFLVVIQLVLAVVQLYWW